MGKLKRCIEEVKKKSPDVDAGAVCKVSTGHGAAMEPNKEHQTNIDRFIGLEPFDPAEMEMGMKEEMEHKDITKGDPELTKKLVEAHLKEDPHYYTKLKSVIGKKEDSKKVEADYDPAAGGKIKAPISAAEEKSEDEKCIDDFVAEGGLGESIKSTLKDLTRSPKAPDTRPLPPLTKKNVISNTRRHGASDQVKAEEALPSQKDIGAYNTYAKGVSDKAKKSTGTTAQTGPMKIKNTAEEKSNDQKEIDKFVSEKREPGKFNATP